MLVRHVGMTGPSFLKQRVGLAVSEVAALTRAQGCLIGTVMGFIRPPGGTRRFVRLAGVLSRMVSKSAPR
jgi:hypothetical protein